MPCSRHVVIVIVVVVVFAVNVSPKKGFLSSLASLWPTWLRAFGLCSRQIVVVAFAFVFVFVIAIVEFVVEL